MLTGLKMRASFPLSRLIVIDRSKRPLCAIRPGKSRAFQPLHAPALLAGMDASNTFLVVCFLSAGLAEEWPFINSLHISPPFETGKACRIFLALFADVRPVCDRGGIPACLLGFRRSEPLHLANYAHFANITPLNFARSARCAKWKRCRQQKPSCRGWYRNCGK